MPQSRTPFAIFRPRNRSLLRGNLLVLAGFALSFPLAGFPLLHANPLLTIPALLAVAGTIDTLRCLPARRNLYHAAVILYLFMDLLALCLIFFFLLFPYVFPV